MSAIILCLSPIPPIHIDWFYSGTLLHVAGSSLNGLPLWITTFGLIYSGDKVIAVASYPVRFRGFFPVF